MAPSRENEGREGNGDWRATGERERDGQDRQCSCLLAGCRLQVAGHKSQRVKSELGLARSQSRPSSGPAAWTLLQAQLEWGNPGQFGPDCGGHWPIKHDSLTPHCVCALQWPKPRDQSVTITSRLNSGLRQQESQVYSRRSDRHLAWRLGSWRRPGAALQVQPGRGGEGEQAGPGLCSEFFSRD